MLDVVRMPRRTSSALLLALLGGATGCDAPPRLDADAARPAASGPMVFADGTALLDGVAPGGTIAGATLLRVFRTEERSLALDFELGKAQLTIWIAKKGTSKFLAPRSTERYDLYIGAERGELQPEAVKRLFDDVEQRVRRTEMKVPAPEGL